jgi:hypothetical protein
LHSPSAYRPSAQRSRASCRFDGTIETQRNRTAQSSQKVTAHRHRAQEQCSTLTTSRGVFPERACMDRAHRLVTRLSCEKQGW